MIFAVASRLQSLLGSLRLFFVDAPRPLRKIKSTLLMLISLGPGCTFRLSDNHYADSRNFYSEVIAQEVT